MAIYNFRCWLHGVRLFIYLFITLGGGGGGLKGVRCNPLYIPPTRSMFLKPCLSVYLFNQWTIHLYSCLNIMFLLHRRRKQGGRGVTCPLKFQVGGGGITPPTLPTVFIINFIAVLVRYLCQLTGEGNHVLVVKNVAPL